MSAVEWRIVEQYFRIAIEENINRAITLTIEDGEEKDQSAQNDSSNYPL